MSFFEYLNKKPRSFFLIIGTAMVFLIGIPDYLLPHGVSFSIFYLIPISFAAWYAGKISGIYIALISAAMWFAADILSADPYDLLYVPYWNALVRLAIFLVVVFLLNAFKWEKISAREDYLTGLGNRKNFFELAEKEIKRSERYGHSFSVAYIDIDDFKSINDRFGHAAGDGLLRSTADVIKRNIRRTDIEGRLGGDEFGVLLPEISPEATKAFFTKLHEKLHTIKVYQQQATFSIGVVTFLMAPSSSDEMMRAVDDLMYAAKKSGKNAVKYKVIDAMERLKSA